MRRFQLGTAAIMLALFLLLAGVGMLHVIAAANPTAPSDPLAPATGNFQTLVTSPFSQSTKTVNRTFVQRGDVLTYTILLRNDGSTTATVRITDTMPSVAESALLTFPTGGGGTVLFPGGTGSFIFPGSLQLPSASDWVWTGVIGPGAQVKLTLRITLRTDLTQTATFSNQIWLNDGLGNRFRIASADTTYDANFYLYLPIVMKNYPPSLPPVTCAPTYLTDIPVGNQPRDVAIDLTRNRIYTADENSARISVIDGWSNTVVKTITGGGISAPTRLAFDAASDVLWVASRGSVGTVNVYWVNPITVTTYQIGPAVTLPAEATAMVFNPVDHNLYIAHRWANSVTVVSGANRQVVKTFGVGQEPARMAVHPQTGGVYVANFASDDVSVVNAAGVQTTISLFDSQEPFGVTVDAASNHVHVSTVGTNRIVTIDAASNQVLGWTAFLRQRQTGDSRVPLRALALNPWTDSSGNRHLWAVAAYEDAITEPEQYTQILFIAKGYPGFDAPVPNPATPNSITGNDLRDANIAINSNTNRVYINLPGSNAVRVLADSNDKCFGVPFRQQPDIVPVPGP